ncbi:unnamed protein product [Rotaria socialis]|uniref:Methyltransferase FkbM domain-containing protein n=1 Tax=Rotaria socialis TaxID=392032 RepID=A0A820WFX0_9BILA|nr:unnamed protein product [Rotaria socialis]CAF4517434.1 unnamed protein product [Rotaria socialis]
MENCFTTIFNQRKRKSILFALAIAVLYAVYYFKLNSTIPTTLNIQATKTIAPQIPNLSKYVNIIDLHEDTKENFTCIETKYLLHIVKTTICLHDTRDAVSNDIKKKKIWEERLITEVISFLIKYPHMDFIDVGANVGSYTMFAASFGRRVISIECFKPNINRIRKAVQIENVQDKVVLVGNAIYSESGKTFKMNSDPFNVGAQAIIEKDTGEYSNDDMYAVTTIRFDEILPILQDKDIRNAVMKVDIQWAEIFLCETGKKVFDYVNIPVVLMEWDAVPHAKARMGVVLKFFIERGYVATKDMCADLNTADAFNSWPGDIFWVNMNRSQIC